MTNLPRAISIIVLTGCLCGVPGISQELSGPRAEGETGRFLDLGGSHIYYEECGSGPAIVLLHDGLVHSVTWDGVWAPLCAKYHVMRYDRRGFGRSDAPGGPFSPVDDLYRLLTNASIEHAIVVGSSSGGALAIDFALEHPGMVDGLFLIGPVLHGMQDSGYFLERGEKNNEPMQRGDARATAENWSKDRFMIAGDNSKARQALYEALIRSPQNLKYTNRLEINPTPAARTRLAEIQAPAMILAGEADIADVHAYCGAINAGIRESARVVIREAGHLIQMEKPEEIVKRLDRFSSRAARTRVTLPPEVLQSYAGRYKTGDTVLTLTIEGGHLLGRIAGAGDFLFFPGSKTDFFARLQDVDIGFEKGANGKVTQMVVRQAGTTVTWVRI